MPATVSRDDFKEKNNNISIFLNDALKNIAARFRYSKPNEKIDVFFKWTPLDGRCTIGTAVNHNILQNKKIVTYFRLR